MMGMEKMMTKTLPANILFSIQHSTSEKQVLQRIQTEPDACRPIQATAVFMHSSDRLPAARNTVVSRTTISLKGNEKLYLGTLTSSSSSCAIIDCLSSAASWQEGLFSFLSCLRHTVLSEILLVVKITSPLTPDMAPGPLRT